MAGHPRTGAVINILNMDVFVRQGYPHTECSVLLGNQPPKFQMPTKQEMRQMSFEDIMSLYIRYGWTQHNGNGHEQLRAPIYEVAEYRVVELTQILRLGLTGAGNAEWQLSREVVPVSGGTIAITGATSNQNGPTQQMKVYKQGLRTVEELYTTLREGHGLDFFRRFDDSD